MLGTSTLCKLNLTLKAVVRPLTPTQMLNVCLARLLMEWLSLQAPQRQKYVHSVTCE